MSQAETNEASSAEERPITLVAVPEDKVQAVVNFIAALQKEDTDVSGFLLSLGSFGGIGPGILNETITTNKNCVDTQGGKDRLCDTDSYTKF